MKRIAVISFIIGILAILASVVIAFLSAANTNIVGGAGWLTFLYHFGQISWLAWIGAVLTVAAIVACILRKK